MMAKFHLRGAQYSQAIFYRETLSEDGKADLEAIIRRSAHFIDQCQRRTEEKEPRRRTMYPHTTNGSPRLAIPTDVLGMATQTHT